MLYKPFRATIGAIAISAALAGAAGTAAAAPVALTPAPAPVTNPAATPLGTLSSSSPISGAAGNVLWNVFIEAPVAAFFALCNLVASSGPAPGPDSTCQL
ncbi:hypothetical protein [Nocardia stercoris]|uniref:Secreted protein n=1 Tax=Nocardia stercoris TaxID=2483361 RepID=A0A3M2L083_9NOCA|nr:hypothetical protein [Nocardia stercoris]RMI30971.1 hypothetical protein EBN03_20310 [Nocardia stercoris]